MILRSVSGVSAVTRGDAQEWQWSETGTGTAVRRSKGTVRCKTYRKPPL